MSSDKVQILVADDDISHCMILQVLLRGWGYQAASVHSGLQALEQIHQQVFDLVLCDVRTAGMDSIATLKEIKVYNPAIPVLIMTASSSVGAAAEAIKSGALDYLVKPLDFDILQQAPVRALVCAQQNESDPSATTDPWWDMIGGSPTMWAFINNIVLVAPSDATVLVCSEPGAGKESVARIIHAYSERREKPLVTLNCAALNESLLEPELSDHEKGAFTEADRWREGRFVEADGDTLLLDEIDGISPLTRACLLWTIQERKVQYVGSNQTFAVDVRLIATIHYNLAEEVSTGCFRQDLYYCLNVVTINMPPLRQYREDIPLLAQHFLKCYVEYNRKTVQGSTPQTVDLLVHYPWPGNIRELESMMEQVVVLLTGDHISERELPLAIAGTPLPLGGSKSALTQPLVEVEKEVTLAVLKEASSNKTEAARQLGIT